MYSSRLYSIARQARLPAMLLALSSSALAGESGSFALSDPQCRGALCYVLVSDDSGSGVLVKARGLHRAQTLALETRDALQAGHVMALPAACAPVPELCPAG